MLTLTAGTPNPAGMATCAGGTAAAVGGPWEENIPKPPLEEALEGPCVRWWCPCSSRK